MSTFQQGLIWGSIGAICLGYLFKSTTFYYSCGSTEYVVANGKNLQVTINGKTYLGRESVRLSNGNVWSDDVKQFDDYDDRKGSHKYEVIVNGEVVDRVDTIGSVTVNGNCGSVHTTGQVDVTGSSGDISTTGVVSVGGNSRQINTMGSVTVGETAGSISTMDKVIVHK